MVTFTSCTGERLRYLIMTFSDPIVNKTRKKQFDPI